MVEPSPLPRRDGAQLARGVCRGLTSLGYAVLTEVSLANARRADVMGLGRRGEILIVEVKSSIEDFRTDRKWPDYQDYCDGLYFAVATGFPVERLPTSCGLIVADGFFAEIVRPAPPLRLAAARRKAVTLRFAQLAAERFQRLVDPGSAP
jgi:hypothetical protein